MRSTDVGPIATKIIAAGSKHLRHQVLDRRCEWPAGYQGRAGEVWLARVLPPPAGDGDTAVVFTTPYVIKHPGVAGWQAYLDRTLPAIDRDPRVGYERLMKRGLDERFWFEYAFEAYLDYEEGAVFLKGLPDVAESRPHSQVNADRQDVALGG